MWVFLRTPSHTGPTLSRDTIPTKRRGRHITRAEKQPRRWFRRYTSQRDDSPPGVSFVASTPANNPRPIAAQRTITRRRLVVKQKTTCEKKRDGRVAIFATHLPSRPRGLCFSVSTRRRRRRWQCRLPGFRELQTAREMR